MILLAHRNRVHYKVDYTASSSGVKSIENGTLCTDYMSSGGASACITSYEAIEGERAAFSGMNKNNYVPLGTFPYLPFPATSSILPSIQRRARHSQGCTLTVLRRRGCGLSR